MYLARSTPVKNCPAETHDGGGPHDPRPAWQRRIAPRPATDALLRRDWENHYYTAAHVTAASVAEGVCVLAEPHRQQVIALDAATGERRWRIAVDGRVESPPTIHRGLVLFGTRNGWVCAVNRDGGESVWRYFAAPSAERIAVNGQLESVWPVFGSVVAEGADVWAFAGRHSDLDGGIRWVRLDAATGAPRAAGRLGYTDAFPLDQPFESLLASHVAFRERGVRPVLAIEDTAFGGEDPPGIYADTEDDDLAHCAPESLGIVGAVSLAALETIGDRLAKIDRFARSPLTEVEGSAPGEETEDAAAEPDAADR